MSLSEAISSLASGGARVHAKGQGISLGATTLFLGVQREAFGLVDTDKSGGVSAAEFSKLGKDDRAGAAVFAALDADGDGQLVVGDLASSRLFSRDNLNVLLGLQEAGAGDFVLERADIDGDGGLSAEEFAAFAPARTGLTSRDIPLLDGVLERQFAEMDADGNGALNSNELSAGFDGAAQPIRLFGGGGVRVASPLFERTDSDADGVLSAAELSAAAGDDAEGLASFVKQADTGGDGQVDRSELDRMIGLRAEDYDRGAWRVAEAPNAGELLLSRLLHSTAWALTDQFAASIGSRLDASA